MPYKMFIDGTKPQHQFIHRYPKTPGDPDGVEQILKVQPNAEYVEEMVVEGYSIADLVNVKGITVAAARTGNNLRKVRLVNNKVNTVTYVKSKLDPKWFTKNGKKWQGDAVVIHGGFKYPLDVEIDGLEICNCGRGVLPLLFVGGVFGNITIKGLKLEENEHRPLLDFRKGMVLGPIKLTDCDPVVFEVLGRNKTVITAEHLRSKVTFECLECDESTPSVINQYLRS